MDMIKYLLLLFCLHYGCLATPLNPRSPTIQALSSAQQKFLNVDFVKVSPPSFKYFNEAAFNDNQEQYDVRYFSTKLDHNAKRSTLRRLFASWLAFTTENDIETWLAHGTLLGWWWNAQSLPWDHDGDVQVFESTLRILATQYNSTHYAHQTNKHSRQYYHLDISPFYTDRWRGDEKNMIDGRWIDQKTGMYIDITGISNRSPERPKHYLCKNNHQYTKDDIYPLRSTGFEGEKAYGKIVPMFLR